MSRLRELSTGVAIYGAGDIAIQVTNFLLLPIYVAYLMPTDYGVIFLLAAIEAPAKLFFRWGLDGAFMRYWYDCDDDAAKQRLTSTVFFYLLVVNGILLAAAVAAAPFLAGRLVGVEGYTLAVQLVLLNTFAVGFTFIPFHVLRIENRPAEFSALAFGRSLATLVLRLTLVVGFNLGVMGVVYTDIVVTAVLLLVVLPWFKRLIRPAVSTDMLRKALAFGLPRVPHGLALQFMAVADRFILKTFRSVSEVGIYSMGVSFGLIPKMVLAAFETAWAPFYYATSKEPGAPRIFAMVTTYGIAGLALMTAGLSAIAADLLTLMTQGRFTAAAPVVGWTAVGVFFYGIYLLTSIGLNITTRTGYYPVSTGIGAAVNLVLNLTLVPTHGMAGAAWANASAYAIQCGIAYRLSQRFYPIEYERGRIARAVAAPLLGYLAAWMLPVMTPLAGVLVRGGTVVGVSLAVLWSTGFFNTSELQLLRSVAQRKPSTPMMPTSETTGKAGVVVQVDVADELVTPRTKGDGR